MGLPQAPNSQRQSVDAILGLVRDALPFPIYKNEGCRLTRAD